MSSGAEIEDIVQYFRDHIEISPISSAKDAVIPKNDILMSYIMSEGEFSRQTLVDVFKEINALKEWLMIAQEEHRQQPEKKLPSLPPGITYESQLKDIANAISLSSPYFAFGSGRKGEGGMLLAAVPDQQVYMYPSREEANYLLLKSEIPANVPILNAGFYDPSEDGSPVICIRANSIVTASALFEVLKPTPEFEGLGSVSADEFECNAYGIAVAHELGRALVAKMGPGANSPSDAESAAWECAKKFLEENRVPKEIYTAYRKIISIGKK